MFPRVTKSPERYVWHPNVYKAALPEGRKKIIQDEIFEKKIKHFFFRRLQKDRVFKQTDYICNFKQFHTKMFKSLQL